MIWTTTSGARERAGDPGIAVLEGPHRVEEVRHRPHAEVEAAFASSAVASVWPNETVTPRACRPSMRSSAPGARGERHQPDRPGGEQPLEQGGVRIAPAAGGCVPRRPLGEERALEMHAEHAGPVAVLGTCRSAPTSCSSGAVMNAGRYAVTPVSSSASPARG